MRHLLFIAGAAACLAAAPAAAQTSAPFTVSLTITNECQINSAGNLVFGSNGVIDANIDASSTLTVQCTNSTPYNVQLNAGTGSGATVTVRRMTGPASATVDYALYRETGLINIWGQTNGTNTVAGTGNGAAQPISVFGRVPPQNTPAAGAYSDTVTATISF